MNFENLSQDWQKQNIKNPNTTNADQLIQKAKSRTQHIRQKKWWTIAILCLTSIILFVFFIKVGAYNNWSESIGLSLMIVMLLVRIIVELISKHKLKQIDETLDFQTFVGKLSKYYSSRRWIHFILTPILYVAYFGGFVSLLPVFKAQLSNGFYMYIIVSGVLVFLGLALFISYHIKKELKSLEALKQILKA